MPTLVHLVYIHGFQGNDTTFQSFPKHLQEHLAARIPPHLDIQFQSSLYPTYKSIKPISYATKNFLEWLSTQPAGPVILMGHSMGGLLATEAATDPSNNPDRSPGGRPRRIVGVVAFDTPYLGMHPHVVITGLASLVPKGGENGKETQKSESAMNEHPQVQIVDEKVTDDWEAFKRQMNVKPRNAPYTSLSPSSSSLGSSSQLNSPSPSTLSPTPSSLSTPSIYSQSTTRSPSPSSNLVDNALAFISTQNDKPLVRWLRKHADEPFSAAKRWVVEHFQFGVCMFDPAGLKARYTRLVEWEIEGGLWVNYWTKTVPGSASVDASVDASEDGPSTSTLSLDDGKEEDEAPAYSKSEPDLLHVPSPLAAHTALTKSDYNLLRKQEEKQRKQDEKQLKQEEKDRIKQAKDASKPKKPKSEEGKEEDEAPAYSKSEPDLLHVPTALAVHTAPTKSEHNLLRKQEEQQRKQEEKQRKQEEKQLKQDEKQLKQDEKDRIKKEKDASKPKKPKTERHFVVLPNGVGQFLGGMEKWEDVPIAGVKDEVNAHTGLFIPTQNLEYEELVGRVAQRVVGWCDGLAQVKHTG